MKRVRLTQRTAADQTPYPGNVNQPDRTDPAMDKYDNFKQQVNHDLPDMRTEWKNDERDDIGFGIADKEKSASTQPKMASARIAANKAVK